MKRNLLGSVFVVGVLVLVFTAWCSQAQAAVYRFDFDSDYDKNNNQHSGVFHLQSGFTQVMPDHQYGGGNWFGWDADLSPGRDRGAIAGDPQSDLHRDLHFSDDPYTFLVDVANDFYTVIIHFRNSDYPHDNIQVQANGDIVLPDVDVPDQTTVIETFTIEITDELLELEFSDTGGSDPNWIVSGLEIVPIPGSVLLLGTGVLGLGLLGFRRKKSP